LELNLARLQVRRLQRCLQFALHMSDDVVYLDFVYKRCGKSPEKGIATSTGGRKTTAFNRIVNELLRKQEAEQHKDGDPFIVRLRFSIQLLGSL